MPNLELPSTVVILGDPHVGKNTGQGKSVLGTNLNSRIADQINLLDWTLDRALENQAGHIIVTGDIFEDPKPHPSLLTLFISWLKKCQVHDVHVHIIIGNHDILRSGFSHTSSLDIISAIDLDNVSVYKDIDTILIGGTAFTMLPFRDRKSFSVATNAEAISLLRDSLVYELASIPVTYQKVLIGHLAIEGSIPVGDEIDDIANELFCPLDMFVGYDYTWMGHVHKPQVMQKSPHIAHIGSMDVSNFGETEQKKFIIIFDCNTKDDPWMSEHLPTRNLKKFSITVPKDTEDPTEYVLEQLKEESWDKAIVRVDVSLASSELKSVNKATIEKYLSSKGAFNITGITEAKKAVLVKKDDNNTIDTKMDVSTSIKTYADRYVDDKSRPSFTELAIEIFNLYKIEDKDAIIDQVSMIGNRMKPRRLYIKDFMCYDRAYIDFEQFSSALIVGRSEGDPDEANGVGKTTIFKSMEYVLFNQSNFNLERIIRDDANACKVIFDFAIGDQEYRLTRTRTRKGSTDLSLYERTTESGQVDQVLHDDINEPIIEEKYWKDISGRRAADTEKDLAKLLKINYKSFRSFVHFVQHDFTSLATATPEKRKAILKDALNLAIYAKLEKIAKDKSAAIIRELDRCRILIDNLSDPESNLILLHQQKEKTEKDIVAHTLSLKDRQSSLEEISIRTNELTTKYNGLEEKLSTLVNKEQALIQGKSKTETSIKEYQTKKTNVIQDARNLISEVKQLEETQVKLVAIDFSQIDILAEKIEEKKVLVTQHNVNIKNCLSEYEELKIPMPTDSVCKHCRQPMTDQHRRECAAKDQARIVELQNSVKESKSIIQKTNIDIQAHQLNISNMTLSKQHLESVMTKIVTKKNEIANKRELHEEYSGNFKKFSTELEEKEKELVQLREELKTSSIDEAKVLHKQIENEKQSIKKENVQITIYTKELTHFTNQKAVLQHNINLKTQDRQKKTDLVKLVGELENKLGMYPLVIQAFSSTGIPNLVIHNILDDLQIEVNKLLSQFRPGLQLSFAIEKTKGDGTEADTLDIQYLIGGKERYYEQLSGAMQLMVLFSLKLGLSFLLQNLLGIEVKFLLLDELDQSLSKGRVDAFVDIIKVLQKDFTILIITHNDNLKDKFENIILVEQNINMISTAKVVSAF